MKTTILKSFTAAALLAAGTSASAAMIYDYNFDPNGVRNFGGGSGLQYDSISATYNGYNQDFSFTVDYEGAAATGGWLVVSPGPNPKGNNTELGIAYFDAASGNVWLYAYNGQNNSNSWQTESFLGFYENAYTTVGGVATLAFNAADANSGLETGFAFGDNIGIWFHPVVNSSIVGDDQGLTQFGGTQGWFDVANHGRFVTSRVPEPSSMLLLGLGLAAMGLRRRTLSA